MSINSLTRVLLVLTFNTSSPMVCNCKDGENPESTVGRHWQIASKLVLKILKLLYISQVLSLLGNVVECFLNVIPICKKILKGRVKKPLKDSPDYFSFLGHLDKRWEMDSNIKPGDSRYFAHLSVMASKLSYENENCAKDVLRQYRWKMEFEGLFNYWNDYQKKSSTQVLMLREKNTDPRVLVVAFRGTECFAADDWFTDFDISCYHLCPLFGDVHGGFLKALGLELNDKIKRIPVEVNQKSNKPLAYYEIKEKLRKFFIANKEAKYILTGHSLGGALAVLFAALLAYHKEYPLLERLEGVYTFGQPRVGNHCFAKVVGKKFKEHHVKYLRIVYGNDVVPRVPFNGKKMSFKHFGTCIHFNKTYEGKITDELPYKNYFSLEAMIWMRRDSAFELIRSFTIEKERGAGYKEGTLLKICRAFGLVLPGLLDHGPQDYVNSIRLGSPELF